MLIEPPNDNDEIKPEKELPPYVPPFGLTWYEDYRRVKLFDNCPNWKCECGLTNHGRNERCARYTCKKSRPNEWKPYEWENSL